MRCPKCGFISFDYLETCLKCKKKIKRSAESVPGTVYNVAAPLFLRLDARQDETSEDGDFFNDIEGVDVADVVDEELEVLIEEDEAEGDAVAAASTPVEPVTPVEEEGGEEEDREIEFDFSQFGDTVKRSEAVAEEKLAAPTTSREDFPEIDELPDLEEDPPPPAAAMAVPDDLLDISDLAPPGKGAKTAPLPKPPPSPPRSAKAKQDDELGELELDDLDIDIDLGTLDGQPGQAATESKDDGMGFDLGILDEEPATRRPSSAEPMLSLDDIDFSITPLADSPGKGKRPAGNDEFDFDIDLGDLSLDKEDRAK